MQIATQLSITRSPSQALFFLLTFQVARTIIFRKLVGISKRQNPKYTEGTRLMKDILNLRAISRIWILKQDHSRQVLFYGIMKYTFLELKYTHNKVNVLKNISESHKTINYAYLNYKKQKGAKPITLILFLFL